MNVRISIADDERSMKSHLQTIVGILGHTSVSAADNGKQLVEDVERHKPDLIITDVMMPEMDGIEASNIICQKASIPIILISAHHELDLIKRSAKIDAIFSYLIKPVSMEQLKSQILVCMNRHHEFQEIQKESDANKQALEDRKLIERAKSIVMKKHGLDEPNAFRSLQKFSNDSNRKLVDIARSIIEAQKASEAMEGLV